MQTKQQTALFLVFHFLLFTIYNLGHPVTSQFITDIHGPEYLMGLLLGAMAFGGFVFAPIWGQVAQKYGFRIIALGPLGYAVGQLGFVFISHWPTLVLFRLIAGIFASINATLHFVYISKHAQNSEDRTRQMGYAALLLTASAGAGYILGGFIGNTNPRMTFIVQIIVSLCMAVAFYVYIPKEDMKEDVKINMRFMTQNIKIMRSYANRGLVYIIILTFLNMIANSILITSSFLRQLNKLYMFSSQAQGIAYSIAIILSAVLSYVFVNKILIRIKTHTNMLPYLAFISMASGVAALALMQMLGINGYTALLLLFIITTTVNTIFVTVIQEILSQMARDNEHSQLTGLNQSAQSLALFVGSTAGGFLFASNIYFPLYVGTVMFALIVIYNIMLKASRRY